MNPNHIKIIQIINKLEVGGIERVVVELCNQYVSLGHHVYLIVLTGDNNDMFEISEKVHIIFLKLNVFNFSGVFYNWVFGSSVLKKIFNEIKPDIIHVHSYFQVFAFQILSIKRSGIQTKIFRTVHTSGLFYASEKYIDKFRRKIELITIKNSEVNLIAISNTIFLNNHKFFGKHSASNTLIYNGINLKKYHQNYDKKTFRKQLGFCETDILITYVSRFVDGKNHQFLLDVISGDEHLFKNCKFLFLGDGPLLTKCQEFVLRHDLKNTIYFEGSVKNVNEYLLSSDIALFPSDFEGFPISLIEKMSSKLPVLASDIDIFKEILLNNETGLIFKLGDKGDFIEKLNQLINSKTIRNEIGEKAFQESKKYDIRKIANDLIKQYSNLKIKDDKSI